MTLNLGVRWEPGLPWREIKGRVEQFRLDGLISKTVSTQLPLAGEVDLAAGDPGVPENGVNASLNNFAPRVGFAYDVFGDGKTSIRGGFAIAYDTRIPGVINNRFADLTPFSPQFVLSTLTTVTPGTFTDPLCVLPGTPAKALSGCKSQASAYPFPATIPPPSNAFGLNTFVLSWDPVSKYQVPTLNTWNLTIEREIGYGVLARCIRRVSRKPPHGDAQSQPGAVGGAGGPRLNAIAGSSLQHGPAGPSGYQLELPFASARLKRMSRASQSSPTTPIQRASTIFRCKRA